MTVIRLWVGLITALSVVVTLVHECTNTSSGDFHVSNRPAKAKDSPDLRMTLMRTRLFQTFIRS